MNRRQRTQYEPPSGCLNESVGLVILSFVLLLAPRYRRHWGNVWRGLGR